MGQEICLINRQVSHNLLLWGVVRWETDKTAGDIQARLFMARTLDEIVKKCLAEGEAEMVNGKTKAR